MFDPASAAILGGASLFGTLFGGGGSSTQKSTQQMMISPEDQKRINELLGQYQTGVGGLLGDIQQAQGRLGAMPQAGPRFQFTGGVDPITAAIAAAGRQDLLAAEGAQQRNLSNLYQGRPDVANPLRSILGMRSALQQNAQLTPALTQQFARQLSQAQLQEQQLQNEVRNLFAKEQLATNLGLSGLQAQLAGIAPLLQFIQAKSPVETIGSEGRKNAFGIGGSA